MPRVVVGATASALLVLSAVAPARGQAYRWTDEQGVVHYTQGIDTVPQRYRATAVPLGFGREPASPAPQSPSPPGPTRHAQGTTVVRYTPGSRILVDGRINGSGPVRLIVDTGADRTLINPRALVAAGVSLSRNVRDGRIRGVAGETGALAVTIDSLEIGEARVGRLLVYAYDIDQPSSEPSHDGLLGRDFLDQFNISIDADQGLLTLTPR